MVWSRAVQTFWPPTHFTLTCEGTGIVGNKQITALQTLFHVKVTSASLCSFFDKMIGNFSAVAYHYKK
jgi:hypothetical protein